MRENNIDGAIVLTFEHLEKPQKVRHCFTTKVGGPDCAWFAPENTVSAKQVHQTVVHVAAAKDRFGASGEQVQGVDGFVTNVRGLALSTAHADCVPLFFLDPVAEAVGLAHAGWRGTLGGIGAETVRAMARAYGCEPRNILVGIGPSIGRCCFEVHEPVAERFLEDLPAARAFVEPSASSPGKFNLDLWAINRLILTEAGVPAENIEVSGLCTKCDPGLFYSYRRNPEERGRMRAYMELI